MAEQPAVDPRYNPAFQRGYDTVPTGEQPRTASALVPPPPRVTSALQSRVGVEHMQAAPVRQSLADTAAPHTAAAVLAEAPTVQELRPPWTNPFVAVLAVIGVLLIAFGVWLMQFATREADGGELLMSQSGYVLLQMTVTAAPLFGSVGVLILSGVLVLFALHWARLPRHRDVD